MSGERRTVHLRRSARPLAIAASLGALATSSVVVVPSVRASAASSAATITTVAGGTGDGAPLAVAQTPSGVVVVGTTIYVSDVAGNVVRAIDTPTSTETTIAGNGIAGEDGDGGAATDAELNAPGALAADSTGNLYIADTGNCLVRKIDKGTGVISTIAGHYVAGSPAASCSGAVGDGGDATAANLGSVEGILLDSSGNLLLSANGSRVRRVDTNGHISTIVGGGTGVDDLATDAVLTDPRGLAMNAGGDLYIAEGTSGLVRVVDAATSHIATFAGGGGGDPTAGGPATSVALFDVHSVAVGASGEVYIGSSSVYVVDTSANDALTAYADPQAAFGGVDGLAFTAAGALLVADPSAHLLRSIDAVAPHAVSTVAGNGNVQYSGDGADATDAELSLPQAVAADSDGNVYIADTENTVVRRVDTTGKIETIAGTGVQGFGITEGAPATSSTLDSPAGVAVNATGDVFIADAFVGRVYRVDASTHAITTYAGGGSPGDGVGDGGAATAAHLEQPRGLALDAAGNLYVADYGGGRVRRIDAAPGHAISTVAIVNGPAAVALDPAGDLFIAEAASNDVREVDSVSHAITTIAGGGNGASGWGDGLPTTNALLANPSGLAFDADGLLIADTGHCVVRQVDSSGFINVIAGRDVGSGAGVCGTSGDGGAAGDALLAQPQGLAVDAGGEVLIADTGSNRIRSIGGSSGGGGGGGTPPPPERPVVTAVDPVSGLAIGGNDVTIEGTGFASTTTVAFGNTPATNVRNNPDGSITATAPPGSGRVDIRVGASGATSALTADDVYSYVPVVTGVSPASGSTTLATKVTITGAGLRDATSVQFGSLDAVPFTVLTDNTVTTTSPLPAPVGPVDVTVTTAGGTNAAQPGDVFTYQAGGSISGSVRDASASPRPDAFVTLCPSPTATPCITKQVDPDATFTFSPVTDGTYTLTAVAGPDTAQGFLGPLTVSGNTAINGQDFYLGVVASLPNGASIAQDGRVITQDPQSGGPVGVRNHDLVYTFRGCPNGSATFSISGQVWGTGEIIPGALLTGSFTETPTGSGIYSTPISAGSLGGIGYRTISIHTTCPPPPAGSVLPTITAASPASGVAAGGTAITLTGTGFATVYGVQFGSVPARSFQVVSDTRINAVSPAGTGTRDITVTGVAGTSAISAADQFSYAPSITSVNPPGGAGGGLTAVTVTGSGFTGATAVSFGGAAATSFIVVSDTELLATSPAGTGVVDIRVTAPAGTSATVPADHYAYQAPAIAGLSPAEGPGGGGTHVTVLGSGFTGATSVRFGTTPATDVTILDDATLTATSPPGNAIVDVTVSGPAGTSSPTAADHFTYDAPHIDSLSVTAGSTAGGDAVVINGHGFTGTASVAFGTQPAPGYRVLGDDIILAETPAGSGVADVTVSTPGGSDTAASAFTYGDPAPSITELAATPAAPATITAITSDEGFVNGGPSILITGTGISGATTVQFGSAPPILVTAIDAPLNLDQGDYDFTNAGFSYPDQHAAPLRISVISVTVPPGVVGDTTLTVSGAGFSASTPFHYVEPKIVSLSLARSITFVDQAFVHVTTVGVGPGAAGGGAPDWMLGGMPTGAVVADDGNDPTWSRASAAVSWMVLSPGVHAGAQPLSGQVADGTGTPLAFKSSVDAYIVAPRLLSVSPAEGPDAGGNRVVLSGADLNSRDPNYGLLHTGHVKGDGVTFGGKLAPALSATDFGPDTLFVAAPPGDGTVEVKVTVTLDTGITESTTGQYTYDPNCSSACDVQTGPPTTFDDIFAGIWVDPSGTVVNQHGDPVPGASVTLQQSPSGNPPFTPVPAGSAVMSPGNRSNPQITDALGSYGWDVLPGFYDLAVTAPGCTPLTSDSVHVPPPVTGLTLTLNCSAAAPTVSTVSPRSGPTTGGTTVTFAGTGFTSGMAVKFGALQATNVQVASSTSMTAVSPAAPAGGVALTVLTPGGSVGAGNFTYQQPVPHPTALTPPNGTAGTLVTIAGTGFTGATGVTFGSAAASFTAISDTQMTAVAPAGTGPVTVTVTGPGGSGALASFTFPGSVPALPSTTLRVGALAGTRLLTVVSTRGFTIGQVIAVGTGGNRDLGIYAGPGAIVLDRPLQHSHPKGDAVQVAVNPPNLAPWCDPQAASGPENGAITGRSRCSDESPTTVTYALVAGKGPAHGNVVVSPSGAWTYTPSHNFAGVDGFVVRATDNHGTASSPPQLVVLAVLPPRRR